jgi:hypothetical protein
MFEHIVHLQQLHIDFGATQVRMMAGNRDRALLRLALY